MTCTVTGNVIDLQTQPKAGQTLTFGPQVRTVGRSGASGTIPDPVTVTTDASGDFSVALLPGAYTVKTEGGTRASVQIVVPDAAAANFADIMNLTPPPPLSDAEAAVLAAQGYANEAAEARDSVYNGWSPVLSIVSDGARRVQRVVDWTGGEGTKPATGSYIGAAGLVADIADAVDVRGLGIASQSGPDASGIYTWTYTDGSTATADFSAIIALEEAAEDSASAALTSEENAAEDAEQTALDRVQTGLDRLAAAASALEAAENATPYGAEILWQAVSAFPTGWYDTGERLLSSVSQRAVLSNDQRWEYAADARRPEIVIDFKNEVYRKGGAPAVFGDVLSATGSGSLTANGWEMDGATDTLSVKSSAISEAFGGEMPSEIAILIRCAFDYTNDAGAKDLEICRWQADGDNRIILQEVGDSSLQLVCETGGNFVATATTLALIEGSSLPYTFALKAGAAGVAGQCDADIMSPEAITGLPDLASADFQIFPDASGYITEIRIFAADISTKSLAEIGDYPPVHLIGDSFLNSRRVRNALRKLIKDDGKYITVSDDAVGGSTLADQLNRLEADTDSWNKTLIIADFGRGDTSAGAISAVNDMAGLLTHSRWGVAQPAVNPPARLDALFDDIDFSSVGEWGEVGLSARTAATVSGVDVYELVENSAGGAHQIRLFNLATTEDQLTLVVEAAANTRDWLRTAIYDSANAFRFANFDLATGVVGSVSSGGSAAHIEETDDGLYRCIFTLPSALDGDNTISIQMASADNTTSYTGDGSSSLYIARAFLYRSDRELLTDDVEMQVDVGSDRFITTLAEAWAESDGSEGDLAEIREGTWPLSLRLNDTNFHPSPAGDQFIADRFYTWLKARGWG